MFLRTPLVCSTLPLLCGRLDVVWMKVSLYLVWNCRASFPVKYAALSETICLGVPNTWMMYRSSSTIFAKSDFGTMRDYSQPIAYSTALSNIFDSTCVWSVPHIVSGGGGWIGLKLPSAGSGDFINWHERQLRITSYAAKIISGCQYV